MHNNQEPLSGRSRPFLLQHRLSPNPATPHPHSQDRVFVPNRTRKNAAVTCPPLTRKWDLT
jgi:hypothetical protein